MQVAKQLSWARLLTMALDAAKGTLYLHTRSPPIAHRDLKSANLLVDVNWHVKVRQGVTHCRDSFGTSCGAACG